MTHKQQQKHHHHHHDKSCYFDFGAYQRKKKFCDKVKACQRQQQTNAHFHLALSSPIEMPVIADQEFIIPVGALDLTTAQEWVTESDALRYVGQSPSQILLTGNTTVRGLSDDDINVLLFARYKELAGANIALVEQRPATTLQAAVTAVRDNFQSTSATSIFTVMPGDEIEFVGIPERSGALRVETLQLSSIQNIAFIS